MEHSSIDEARFRVQQQCHQCGTPHDAITGGCPRPQCPAFVVASGGGYTPPRPRFVRDEHCWEERRYGVIWGCLILALVLALLSLFCCCLFLTIKVFLAPLEYGLLVKGVAVAQQGFYVPNDERVFNRTMQGNETFVPESYNTSKALENVCAVPVRTLRWSNDWFMIVNETAAWNRTTMEMNEAPEVQGFYAPDLVDVFPEAQWQMVADFPNTGKVLNETLDQLQTVCLERLVVELWAAMQELKLRVDECTCADP